MPTGFGIMDGAREHVTHEPRTQEVSAPMLRYCSIPDCERRVGGGGRGWCHMHYMRWWQHGGSRIARAAALDSAAERFWTKVNFTGPVPEHRPELGPCWLWTASTTKGYGGFGDSGLMVRAHRWAYEFCVGPIPEGLTLDHLCRVKACVNTDHLEPVTQRVNVLRSPVGLTAINARKTHCYRGHAFTEKNTYLMKAGGRRCKECRTELQGQWRRRISA